MEAVLLSRQIIKLLFKSMNIESRFLRLPQVIELTTLSKTSIYRLIADGDFPEQVPIGSRSVVWVRSDVEDWCDKKIAAAQ